VPWGRKVGMKASQKFKKPWIQNINETIIRLELFVVM
jgi:hypothetical protein